MVKPSKRALLVGVGVLVVLAALAVGAFTVGPLKPRHNEQPIAFPHDKHAGGTNQIPCMYCHSSADRSVDAGIPAVQVCAGCHVPGGVAAAGARADSAEVRKVVAYWKEQKPIPWVRIHDLPDHVHFPHYRHINAGVTCQTCHGEVQNVKQVKQESSLRMGWCISCHEERKVRTDCFVCHY
jgi:hypothetical protein